MYRLQVTLYRRSCQPFASATPAALYDGKGAL
jgi:hypothetical protein